MITQLIISIHIDDSATIGRLHHELRMEQSDSSICSLVHITATSETGCHKTLQHRCSNIVTEPEDRRKEEEHITRALQECGYKK